MPDLDTTLAALADPTRRAVIDLLKAGPVRASKLADALALSAPAMSRHLRVLRRAELVREESPPNDARVRLYQLNRGPFDELEGWLHEVEAFWGEQLDSFKRHVEASARRRRP